MVTHIITIISTKWEQNSNKINGNKLQGRRKTTLPSTVFNRDLALIQHQISLDLHSFIDLAKITDLAQNRESWRGLASQIPES